MFDPDRWPILLVSITIIALGLVFLDSDTYKKLLRFQNMAKGTKSEITPQTLEMGKLLGIGMIIVGALMFLFGR